MYIERITSAELLARYNRGIRAFRNLQVIDVEDTPLVGADLRDIIIEECGFRCDFTGADLRGARIDSEMKTCDFTNADLRDADFSGSALCSATFLGAKMDGANFEGAYYHGFDSPPAMSLTVEHGAEHADIAQIASWVI